MVSISHDSPMADQISEADIALNWRSVALARSQRILQSWLTPERTPQCTPQAFEDGNNEDNFSGEDETGGLGSKRRAEDDEELSGIALKRQKLTSNDKLLQQLLGTKAATLKRKEQAKAKATTKAISILRDQKQAEEGDEDEEDGRSSAFVSRKQRHDSWRNAKSRREAQASVDSDGHDSEELGEVDEGQRTQPPAAEYSEPEPVNRLRKIASGNYLDEILGRSAKKKSKKKKKGLQNQEITT